MKTVKLDGRDIPCNDVLETKMVYVSDEIFYEIRYRIFEPTFAIISTLLPRDKGYKVELAVRKAINKR